MRVVWQTAIGITVSLLLLYWAFHDVSFSELWQHVRAANLWLLGLAIVIQTGTFVIRAARWRVFLAPVLPSSSFRARFATTCIGFMANNLLPARVGEFARAYALSRTEKISASAAFGSLVVERLFDAFVLALFLAVPVLLPGLIDAPGLGDRLLTKVMFVFIAFGGLAATIILIIVRPDIAIRIFRLTLGKIIPRKTAEAIERALSSFVGGLNSMRDPTLVITGVAWSLFHWGWGALAYFVGMRAFGIHSPGYLGALFLQSVNAFAVAIPSSPGFFGLFEASVRLALTPFGVSPGLAVGFAAAFHIGTFVPVTVIGIYYLGRLGLSWRDVEHSEEVVEEIAAGKAKT